MLERLEKAMPPKGAKGRRENSDVAVAQWRKELRGSGVDAFTLATRLRRIAILLDDLTSEASESAGLKINDVLLLLALRRIGPPYCMRPTDILKMQGITSGAATYRIDQLTNQGLAERAADPNDRRGYLIYLTPKGKEVIDSILAEIMASFERKLKPLASISGAMSLFEQYLRLFERCMEQQETLRVEPGHS
jgi:DNA-binding MarR family transcriptional regulator